MAQSPTSRVLSEWQGKWLLSLYPPLLFQRVRVLGFEPGFRRCRVCVHHSVLTRNLNGTTFGGTIFSGADPFYAIMYWQIFARLEQPVRTWLKSASIRYLKPAKSSLTLDFVLNDREIDETRAILERDGRCTRTHDIEAVDREGTVCAEIQTEVYLRFALPDHKQVSTF